MGLLNFVSDNSERIKKKEDFLFYLKSVKFLLIQNIIENLAFMAWSHLVYFFELKESLLYTMGLLKSSWLDKITKHQNLF